MPDYNTSTTAFTKIEVRLVFAFFMQCSKQSKMVQLPSDLLGHVAKYIADDVRAADPKCYRAARSLQAAWRGWVTRFQAWRCGYCGKRTARRIKMCRFQRRCPFVCISIDCDLCHDRRMLDSSWDGLAWIQGVRPRAQN